MFCFFTGTVLLDGHYLVCCMFNNVLKLCHLQMSLSFLWWLHVETFTVFSHLLYFSTLSAQNIMVSWFHFHSWRIQIMPIGSAVRFELIALTLESWQAVRNTPSPEFEIPRWAFRRLLLIALFQLIFLRRSRSRYDLIPGILAANPALFKASSLKTADDHISRHSFPAVS